jgi:hypothetical protein
MAFFIRIFISTIRTYYFLHHELVTAGQSLVNGWTGIVWFFARLFCARQMTLKSQN